MAATPHLTGRHTIFGIVEEGQDVAEAISQVETDRSDRPNMDVVLKIEKIDGDDNRALLDAFELNLECSLELYRDADDDGAVSSADPRLAHCAAD